MPPIRALNSATVQKALKVLKKQRINELEEYINSQGTQISEYNDKLVRKYIDKIRVYDDKFMLCFKARMEIVVAR